MKVLFVGHYREGSGWAQAAIDWILALDAAGVDVVCRPIKLNNENPAIPERVKELEAKSSVGCDYNIQNVLPHFMDYSGSFKKNVGLFFSETLNLTHTGWPSRLNTMDEVWVPSKENLDCLANSGVTVPSRVVNCATDIWKFDKEYKKYELPELVRDTFKFYFIGENIRRKHLTAALIAFYTNFTKYDNASFIIKTHKSGQDFQKCMDDVENNIRAIKDKLRLYNDHGDYPLHCIITGHLPESDIYSIHQQCDCFCMPSFGEGWCIPAFDAMGFGKKVVATETGGLTDFLSDYTDARVIKASVEPVVGYDVVFNDMHTGLDLWKAVSIRDFGLSMKHFYNTRNVSHPAHGLRIRKWSYEAIGHLMKENLEK